MASMATNTFVAFFPALKNMNFILQVFQSNGTQKEESYQWLAVLAHRPALASGRS